MFVSGAMAFVHRHATGTSPAPNDLCLVIEADRLMGRPDVSSVVELPEFSAVKEWTDSSVALVHVGLLDTRSCWVLGVGSSSAVPPEGWQWHETRSLLGVLNPDQSQAISCARQLLWWERRHQFCGVCGAPTIVATDERARRCPKCNALFFPVVSPAVIVAVTRGDELLLAHNRNFRSGMFSLLAGFVDPGETLEQAAVREVGEEVGIAIDDLRYVTSQPWSFPNSLMIGFRANYVSGEITVDQKEIEQAGWFRRTSMPEIPRVGTVARSLIDAWLSE